MTQIFSFILFFFVWTIVSNSTVAQDRFEIDEEGNIILLEKEPTPPKKPASTKPSAPMPTEQKPDASTTLPPKPEVKKEIEVPPAAAPASNGNLKFPLKATVTVKMAQLRATASNEGRILALLRQGDELEVLSQEENFLQARFLLEGQFPIEGWIISDSLQLFQAGQRVEIPLAPSQAYEASKDRPQVQTEVKEFPDLEDGQAVELLPNPKPSSAPTPSTVSVQPKVSRAKAAGSWHWRTGMTSGWTRYSESLETKINGKAADGSFLDYHLDGLRLDFTGAAFRNFYNFSVGARANYAFSFFNSSVSADNIEIESSGVLAQFHQLSLEVFAFRAWEWKRIKFEPELGLSPQFQLFSVNQLREKSLAQPVLFNDLAFFFKANLRPRVYLPYDLIVEPNLSLIFFYYFLEGPKQTTPQGEIQTGTPSVTPFLLHYGLNLAWEMRIFNLENHFVKLAYLHQDFSRKFSGEGNRAGLVMEDASSTLKIDSLALGYEYHF